MTKAKALRNYFKEVYGVDNLTGMSEVSVWKDFLKKNNDFDSNATSMVGVYTEMADNEISFSDGGGGKANPKFHVEFDPNGSTVQRAVKKHGDFYYVCDIFPLNGVTIKPDDFIIYESSYNDGSEPEVNYFFICHDFYVFSDGANFCFALAEYNTEEEALEQLNNEFEYDLIKVAIYEINHSSIPLKSVLFEGSFTIDTLTENATAYNNGRVKVYVPCDASEFTDVIVKLYNGMTYAEERCSIGHESVHGIFSTGYDAGGLYFIFTPDTPVTTDEQARAWFVHGVEIGGRNITALHITGVQIM